MTTKLTYRDGWTGTRKARIFATKLAAQDFVRTWNAAQSPRYLTGVRYDETE